MGKYSIQGKSVELSHSASSVYSFVTNPENFNAILPPDRISDWAVEGKTCSFKVAGVIPVCLRLNDANPYSLVRYVSLPDGKYPMAFELQLSEKPNGTCSCVLKMDYEISGALQMLAGKSLEKIVGMMTEKMREIDFSSFHSIS